MFDSAANRADALGIAHDPGARVDESLSREVHRRVEFWRLVLRAQPREVDGPMRIAIPLMDELPRQWREPLRAVLIVALSLLTFALMEQRVGPLVSGALLSVIGGLVVLGLVYAQRRARARRTFIRAIVRCECPDCGYDLTALQSPKKPGGHPIGPRACPECGSPWPLVPPPAPTGSGA